MYDCYSFIKNEDGAYFTSNMESRGGVTTIEQVQEGDLVTLETRKLDGYFLVDINGWKNMSFKTKILQDIILKSQKI